ncbi:MAG: PHP domain-containing protein [Mailhella sp.]|nr:PHP domain-containing protein [Mailhella sp.]
MLCRADLHIHSCLSPCGDGDMTPQNIAAMARLKGLDMIALTDHNTALNLPAMEEACREQGLILIPGMEVTTREEIHVLAYFGTVEAALAFGETVRQHLPPGKNRSDFFGCQQIMDGQDRQTGEEDALLIGATDWSLEETVRRIRSAGAAAVPAHINRGEHGLLVGLGMMPSSPDFPAVEVWLPLPCPESALKGRMVLHSSDAHYLGDIREGDRAMTLECSSRAGLLDRLCACHKK